MIAARLVRMDPRLARMGSTTIRRATTTIRRDTKTIRRAKILARMGSLLAGSVAILVRRGRRGGVPEARLPFWRTSGGYWAGWEVGEGEDSAAEGSALAVGGWTTGGFVFSVERRRPRKGRRPNSISFSARVP